MESTFLLTDGEVRDALEHNQPVVALESTVITHGLPYPQNRDTALQMEQEVRLMGAIPATVAVMDGVIRVGLESQEIERLSSCKDFRKISARDLPSAITMEWSGGTTVAGSIYCANIVGIQVLATGGIGGVHRGGGLDISADLVQLSRTPIIVVCSGAKAILDLSTTMEVLETFGIPVVGYQTDELPAFYSRSSGIQLETRAESVEEIASLAINQWKLGIESAVLVVNPAPREIEVHADIINKAVEEALNEAKNEHITGKQVTPFLLEKVSELTSGESLQANLGLLTNNARLASEIAVAYSHLSMPNKI